MGGDVPGAAVGEVVQSQARGWALTVVVQPRFRAVYPSLRAGGAEVGLGRGLFARHDHAGRVALAADLMAGFGKQRADRGFGLAVVALADGRVAHLTARVD